MGEESAGSRGKGRAGTRSSEKRQSINAKFLSSRIQSYSTLNPGFNESLVHIKGKGYFYW